MLILPDEEKNKSQQTSNMNRERLAKAAGAMYLSQIISNDDILGVAWGRTIHKLGALSPH